LPDGRLMLIDGHLRVATTPDALIPVLVLNVSEAEAAWSGIDARGRIAAELAPYRGRLDAVNVDAIGVGAYFAEHLKDLGFPVRSIRVGEKSRRPDRFVNLKAELYWDLRERFEKGEVDGLKDEQAVGQLATIRYSYNPRGNSSLSPRRMRVDAALNLRIAPRPSCWHIPDGRIQGSTS
jgi:hypothetical protein